MTEDSDDEIERKMRAKFFGTAPTTKVEVRSRAAIPVIEVTEEVHDGDVTRFWFHVVEGRMRKPLKSYTSRIDATLEFEAMQRRGTSVKWIGRRGDAA